MLDEAVFSVEDFDVEVMVTGEQLMSNMSLYTAIGTELGYISADSRTWRGTAAGGVPPPHSSRLHLDRVPFGGILRRRLPAVGGRWRVIDGVFIAIAIAVVGLLLTVALVPVLFTPAACDCDPPLAASWSVVIMGAGTVLWWASHSCRQHGDEPGPSPQRSATWDWRASSSSA